MNTKLYILLALVCLGIGTMYCNKKSSTPATSSIKKVNYYVRYLEVTRSLYAELILQGDSATVRNLKNVKFQDQAMRGAEVPKVGWRYQAEIGRQPSSPDSAVFSFSTPDGLEVRQAIAIPKIEELKSPSNGFLKKTGGLLAWKGSACGDNDDLVLRITDSTGTDYTVNHIGKTRGAQMEVLAVHVQNTTVGKAKAALTRKQTIVNKEDKRFSWLSTAEYYTKELETMIGE